MAATRALALALLLALLPLAAAAGQPQRIVSMNLCSDQLLLLLAERERIASVSYLAVDPEASAMARQAEGLHLNHGLAEEILPLQPDLVLAGAFTTRPTVFLLRRLGYDVLDLPAANSLDDVRANVRRVAEAIGETARGDALAAAFDARLAALAPPAGSAPPLAALYWANGLSSGRGTLADAIVSAAGLRNLAAERGLNGTGQLPLETLLAADPALLVMGKAREGPALANESFRHPALELRFAGRPQLRIADRYWVCGTPLVANAVEHLATAREAAKTRAAVGSRGAGTAIP